MKTSIDLMNKKNFNQIIPPSILENEEDEKEDQLDINFTSLNRLRTLNNEANSREVPKIYNTSNSSIPEIIVNRNKSMYKEEEKKGIPKTKSIQNIKEIEKREITKILYERQPEKKPQKPELKISTNILKDYEKSKPVKDSQYNLYKRGVVPKLENDYKKVSRTTINSPEAKQPTKIIIKKELPEIQSEYNRKIEAKNLPKIYPRNESAKLENKFISKTYKVDEKKGTSRYMKNYYRIPDTENIGFVETKITTRSQEKFKPLDKEESPITAITL